MLLLDYIEMLYGRARGNKTSFLQDNPTILLQELSRWLKAGLKIRPETGEIYKPVSRRVTVPEHAAVTAGIILSDALRERIGALAATQGLSAETLLRTWVDRDELRQQLAPIPTLNTVPEQHIAGLVSRHLAPLSMVRKLNRPLLGFLTMNRVKEEPYMVRPVAESCGKMQALSCF